MCGGRSSIFHYGANKTNNLYSQTCVKQPPKGSTKIGCLGQVAA